MGLLSFFRKKASSEIEMRAEIGELVMRRLTDRKTGIRCEDAICAAAAIIGERCIDVAGDFPLRDHQIAPGSRVFSDKINELLCGDRAEIKIASLPADSVFGLLRAGVGETLYPEAEFPTLVSVFSGFAAGIGQGDKWGKVPVTVIRAHHPWISPLQFAFETRDKVDAILESVAADKRRCLEISTKVLAALLNRMAGAIPPDIALRLAFEIVNGMAKTAPMTKAAMRAAAVRPVTS